MESSPADRGREAEWARFAWTCGIIAAAGFFVQTLLYLLDTTGLIGAGPVYVKTDAGTEADLASFYAALFTHAHAILWNIAARDVIGPLAYIALILLVAALHRGLGAARPRAVAAVLLLQVGALVAAIADLVFLSQAGYWRWGVFTDTPSVDIIAIGRAAETIGHLSDYLQYAGFLLLAAGLVLLARVAVSAPVRSRVLAVVASAEAVALTVIVAASLVQVWPVYDVLALLTGVVLAPAVALLVARTAARRQPGAA